MYRTPAQLRMTASIPVAMRKLSRNPMRLQATWKPPWKSSLTSQTLNSSREAPSTPLNAKKAPSETSLWNMLSGSLGTRLEKNTLASCDDAINMSGGTALDKPNQSNDPRATPTKRSKYQA